MNNESSLTDNILEKSYQFSESTIELENLSNPKNKRINASRKLSIDPDEFKETIKNLQQLSDNIKYTSLKYEEDFEIQDKKNHLDELKKLLDEFNTLFEHTQQLFYILPQNIKSSYMGDVKELCRVHKLQCEDAMQKRALFNTLSYNLSYNNLKGLNDISDKASINQLIKYSKLNSVIKNAMNTTISADNFIRDLEKNVMKSNIISRDDENYKHYVGFQREKIKLIKLNNERRFSEAKCFFLLFVFIIIIAFLMYFVAHEVYKDLIYSKN